MPTESEIILDENIRHAVNVERFKGGLATRMIKQLNQAEESLIDEIASRLAKIEERGFDLGPATTQRLNVLLENIQKAREKLYLDFDNQLSLELNEFAQYEVDWQVQLPESAGINVQFAQPSIPQLEAIVTAQPFSGALLKDWTSGLADKEINRLKETIRTGMTTGETTDQIVRKIRGTKSAKFSDGILAIGRRDAEAVVLTATAHVQNRAKMTLYDMNADIVDELQFVATLDSRTTPGCAVLDGKVFKRNKAPVLPRHWRCRSILIAFYKWRSVGQRASQTGPVASDLTFEKFFGRQSAEWQNDYLGPTRAALYRKGLPFGKFVDSSGDLYTLSELAARERR